MDQKSGLHCVGEIGPVIRLWNVTVEDMCGLSLAEYRSLYSIARTWWENFVSNSEVSGRSLDHRAQTLEGTLTLNGLRWMEHV